MMKRSRTDRAKMNIAVTLLSQLIAIVCGFIVPRVFLGAFGSEANGLVASVTQFLAYITLLEGGVGGVARAALYKPLADNDSHEISAIYYEIKRFFRVIGFIFAGYVAILSLTFGRLADVRVLDAASTAMLVLIISVSTFAQYFIGISNSVLLNAAQKTYVTNAIGTVATVLNAVFTILLIKLGFNILVVKAVSSVVYSLRPVMMYLYVRKNYEIKSIPFDGKKRLEQKWTGLSQHVAFFLHSNTDIAILTLFSSLKYVSVYYVYNMVISHIQTLTSSFTAGMEALFGDMLAKRETDNLSKTFGSYETMISFVTITLFSSVAAAMIPFVKIYTSGITDANYIRPLFGLVLLLSSVIYCLRTPYHAVVIAAGHFRQTQWAAYGEAAINIFFSLVLVKRFGISGVAAATLGATIFRFVYYVIYLKRNIFFRPVSLFIRRELINAGAFIFSFVSGKSLYGLFNPSNYISWALTGVATVAAAAGFGLILNYIFYREDIVSIIKRVFSGRKKPFGA